MLASPLGVIWLAAAAACGGNSSGGLGPPPPDSEIVAVVLSPQTTSVDTGATVQFSAQVRLKDSQTVGGANIVWSATGGSVTQAGLYTAGKTPGNYRVVGEAGNGLADTSVVSVIAPTPPPPGGVGPGAHEPSGMLGIIANPLTAQPPHDPSPADQYQFLMYGGAAPGSQTLPMDNVLGRKVLQQLYPKGMEGGVSPDRGFLGGATRNFSDQLGNKVHRVYVHTKLLIQQGFTNNGNAGVKWFFIRSGVDKEQNHYINLTSDDQFAPDLRLQSGGVDAANYYATRLPITGNWMDVEILVNTGTAGGSNGSAQVWVNGQQVLNATGVPVYAAGQSATFEYLWLDPTYGGGLQPVPHDQYFRMADWYVSVGG
jgi:hypothetical protein